MQKKVLTGRTGSPPARLERFYFRFDKKYLLSAGIIVNNFKRAKHFWKKSIYRKEYVIPYLVFSITKASKDEYKFVFLWVFFLYPNIFNNSLSKLSWSESWIKGPLSRYNLSWSFRHLELSRPISSLLPYCRKIVTFISKYSNYIKCNTVCTFVQCTPFTKLTPLWGWLG